MAIAEGGSVPSGVGIGPADYRRFGERRELLSGVRAEPLPERILAYSEGVT